MNHNYKRLTLVILTFILAANLIFMLEYRQIRWLGNIGTDITKIILSTVLPVTPKVNAYIESDNENNLLTSRGTAMLLSINSPVYGYYDGYFEKFRKSVSIQTAANNVDNKNNNTHSKSTWKNTTEYSDPLVDYILPGDFEQPIASSIYMDEEGGREDLRKDDSNADYGELVAVNNASGLTVDVKELLECTLNLGVKTGENSPQVLIIHTHATEAYTGGSLYVSKNTFDKSRNVISVGDRIAEKLMGEHGINTLHIETLHDMPEYNAAYMNALATITEAINQYPSIKVILDIHRDGMPDNSPFAPAVVLNGKKAAKVMAVIGTPATGLYHPFWKDNAALGFKFTAELDKIAPGLSRPVYLSEFRYNQHMSRGAIIIEVGGDGNTIEEALESAVYIADAIAAVII